jgi:hypothetical protein
MKIVWIADGSEQLLGRCVSREAKRILGPSQSRPEGFLQTCLWVAR